MSDNWIVLIPEDPKFIPTPANRAWARQRFAEIAPKAWEFEIKVFKTVQFFDCGNNLERILCPSCGAQIPMNWWQDRVSDDYSEGFKLAKYPTPCCKAAHTLHELVYEWPQGLGRFALSAMNPNIGELKDKHLEELEEILDTELRVIYKHL
jgi:hypothetical protein